MNRFLDFFDRGTESLCVFVYIAHSASCVMHPHPIITDEVAGVGRDLQVIHRRAFTAEVYALDNRRAG